MGLRGGQGMSILHPSYAAAAGGSRRGGDGLEVSQRRPWAGFGANCGQDGERFPVGKGAYVLGAYKPTGFLPRLLGC